MHDAVRLLSYDCHQLENSIFITKNSTNIYIQKFLTINTFRIM